MALEGAQTKHLEAYCQKERSCSAAVAEPYWMAVVATGLKRPDRTQSQIQVHENLPNHHRAQP